MGAQRLVNYFFKTLPSYFWANDTYKDQDPSALGRGILERYLSVFQAEAEVTDQAITDMAILPFPLETEEKYLSYVAALYGYPPDTFGDSDWYRALLRNIVQVNKHKGTVRGFEEFFSICESEVVVSVALFGFSNYDSGLANYDDGSSYYDGYCEPCSEVSVNVLAGSGIPGISGPYDADMKRNIQSILLYLLPMNAKFALWKYNSVTLDIDLVVEGEDNLIKFV